MCSMLQKRPFLKTVLFVVAGFPDIIFKFLLLPFNIDIVSPYRGPSTQNYEEEPWKNGAS